MLFRSLKQDPLAAYAELKKIIIEEKIILDKTAEGMVKIDHMNFVYLVEKIFSLFKKMKIIQEAEPYMESYHKGSREIYGHIFRPDIIPNFTFTRLVSDLPDNAEIIDQYKISGKEYDESLVTKIGRASCRERV